MISKAEMKTYFFKANCHVLQNSFKHEFHETTYLKPTFCTHCTGLVSFSIIVVFYRNPLYSRDITNYLYHSVILPFLLIDITGFFFYIEVLCNNIPGTCELKSEVHCVLYAYHLLQFFFFYSGLVTDFFVSKWERRCVCIIYNKIDLARWIPKLIHVQSDSEFYLLLNTFSLVRGCSALWCILVKLQFCSPDVYIKHRACKYLD